MPAICRTPAGWGWVCVCVFVCIGEVTTYINAFARKWNRGCPALSWTIEQCGNWKIISTEEIRPRLDLCWHLNAQSSGYPTTSHIVVISSSKFVLPARVSGVVAVWSTGIRDGTLIHNIYKYKYHINDRRRFCHHCRVSVLEWCLAWRSVTMRRPRTGFVICCSNTGCT